MGFRKHVVMGDPQAPLTTVLELLDRAALLDAGGRVRDDVQLVVVGDCFDWGPVSARQRATQDGVTFLAWLAAHAAEQVILLLGNHDLARVCELAPFETDEAFVAARAQADRIYRGGEPDPVAEAEFLKQYPSVADAESLSRDFSCFSVEQRRSVEVLLRTGRFRLAHAHGPHLVVHAGVTLDDLEAIGVEPTDAAQTAAGLNAWLDRAVAQWSSGPLDLEPLHRAGSAARGWGRGALFHRPADPAHGKPEDFEGPPRRRFDPRRLPPGFRQVIGHIRDQKCRDLMPDWAVGPAAGDGPLRSLRLTDTGVEYLAGCHAEARLIFVDGGMLHAAPGRYELFDLDRGAPIRAT